MRDTGERDMKNAIERERKGDRAREGVKERWRRRRKRDRERERERAKERERGRGERDRRDMKQQCEIAA